MSNNNVIQNKYIYSLTAINCFKGLNKNNRLNIFTGSSNASPTVYLLSLLSVRPSVCLSVCLCVLACVRVLEYMCLGCVYVCTGACV